MLQELFEKRILYLLEIIIRMQEDGSEEKDRSMANPSTNFHENLYTDKQINGSRSIRPTYQLGPVSKTNSAL